MAEAVDVSNPRPEIQRLLTDLERLPWETISDRNFVDEVVYFDARTFERCSFERCRIFVKLGAFHVIDPRAFVGCTFAFDGPAAGVRALLEFLSQQQEPA